ncbi:energy transducer TonB [Pedobacter psychrophilus]|uniref:Energy transducer TonB n=1 Tax=Pedobacter psychrophilus TaxID=1826909 RepID=A0A179DCW4_9SPHI|nr:TonB-dependent receptor [Pedobacter psychrophilus]OAQ38885.1 energy transducer TonB [Pedobacter psychrophilus]
MKTYLFSAFLILLVNSCLGQDFSISGTIRDKSNSQPISFGRVGIVSSNIGVKTDLNGRFSLKIPQNKTDSYLIVSCVGYQSDTLIIVKGKLIYAIVLEPTNSNLNEVVVTGVSRATLARENPIPIVSVSAKKIEQTIESNLIDALVKNVPGLNAVKTGPNISKPFIRGLGYNRVLTLYDGIRQEGQQWGDEHGIEVDPYNIERAEVVKGPSSLIYGSDALAGVVGLIPSSPNHTDGLVKGKFTSEYQGNNSLIGNGLGLTYGNEHWSYALRGSYRMAKNYQNNIDGRVYNSGYKEASASGAIKYISNTGSTALNATLYNNYQGIPDGSRDSLSRKFTYQTNEGINDDILNRPIVSDDILNSYQQSSLNQHIQHYRVYTKGNYQIGAIGTIDALIAFQQNIRKEFTHPMFIKQAGLFVRLNTINYGVNYNLPTFSNINFSIGFNGMYQNNRNKDATDFPIPNYNLFDAGIYGFAKWKQKNWTIGAGVRYDQRNINSDDFFTQKNPKTGFDREAENGSSAGSYLQFPSFDKVFNGISLSFGSTYAINKSVSLKANVARGYRAPSIPEFSSNGLDPGAHIIYLGNRDFNPEFSLQQDFGIDINTKNFNTTFSIFNNNISNYIFLSQLIDVNNNPIVDAQGNKTYQYQQSKAQIYGLEASFDLHPETWKGFRISNSLALTYGFNKNKAFNNLGLQGEYLPLIPPLHIITSISQEINLNSDVIKSFNIRLEADINGSQSRYLKLNNTETFTPGYTLIDFSTSVNVRYAENRHLSLQLSINNLFDKTYQSNLNRLKYFEYYEASPSGNLGIFNMGRNLCLKAIVPF